MRVACAYGGQGIQGQLSDLKKGAEIVVCTPGRMIDVLTTSNGKITNLKRVTYVVIDEADSTDRARVGVSKVRDRSSQAHQHQVAGRGAACAPCCHGCGWTHACYHGYRRYLPLPLPAPTC